MQSFYHPCHVVVDDDNVLVADSYNGGRVVVLRKDNGHHVRSVSTTRRSDFRRCLRSTPLFSNHSTTAHGLAVDPDQPQYMYISYAKNRKIKVVDKVTGAKIRTIQTLKVPNGTGGDEPYGLAVVGRYLYVADQYSHRVQVLDKHSGVHAATVGSNGSKVFFLEGDNEPPSPGRGGGWNLFSGPISLAVDNERLYVCDRNSHCLQVFAK